jgi:hypothetical protein
MDLAPDATAQNPPPALTPPSVPALVFADSNGVMYDTTPSTTDIYRSIDHGASWQQIESADNSSGDDCVTTDQSNALYWCNLASMSKSALPLQADVWKSTVAETCVNTPGSCGWVHGNNITECGTSCSFFGVDRQWTAANIRTGNTTSTADVAIMYHDFYGPSQIWVNLSTDGGQTFGTQENVMNSNPSSGAIEADGYSFCNTVPTGIGIVKPGYPHAGRMFVSWIASDAIQDTSGCNVSMLQSFHTIWVSYSDPSSGYATWTSQLVYDAGIGHDVSTPFASFAMDDSGNPYIAFDSEVPSENPATCATESDQGAALQSDPSCAYHLWVLWSHDGGATWDGGGGGLDVNGVTVPITGAAASAYEVDPSTIAQTDLFPTIAAGDPGQVDVGWLQTNENEPTIADGKFQPGGCAGPGPSNGDPTYYPPTCDWNLYAAQANILSTTPTNTTWTTDKVTTTPMHVGDICNLGIACTYPTSNRNLLDFNMETIDTAPGPDQGCAHIAYADDNTVNMLRVANQTSNCFALADVSPPSVLPEAPLVPLLVPAGMVAAGAMGYVLRRRRATTRMSV